MLTLQKVTRMQNVVDRENGNAGTLNSGGRRKEKPMNPHDGRQTNFTSKARPWLAKLLQSGPKTYQEAKEAAIKDGLVVTDKDWVNLSRIASVEGYTHRVTGSWALRAEKRPDFLHLLPAVACTPPTNGQDEAVIELLGGAEIKARWLGTVSNGNELAAAMHLMWSSEG